MNLFSKKLLGRVKNSVWMEMGSNIVMIIDTDGNPRNLISEYERLTVEETSNHDMNYIGHKIRQSQNYIQVYHFI